MNFILFISPILLGYIVLVELLKLYLYGKLNGDTLDVSNLKSTQWKDFMSYGIDKNEFKYLSSTNSSLLSKWHTESHQIPRWSKTHKEIEAKYKQLYPKSHDAEST